MAADHLVPPDDAPLHITLIGAVPDPGRAGERFDQLLSPATLTLTDQAGAAQELSDPGAPAAALAGGRFLLRLPTDPHRVSTNRPCNGSLFHGQKKVKLVTGGIANRQPTTNSGSCSSISRIKLYDNLITADEPQGSGRSRSPTATAQLRSPGITRFGYLIDGTSATWAERNHGDGADRGLATASRWPSLTRAPPPARPCFRIHDR